MPVGAIIGASVVGAGASIVSGNKAAKAQTQAANTAAASANQADATNRYIYDTTRADYAPYRAVGTGALYKLADMYGVPRPAGAPATGGTVSTMFTGTSTPGYGGMMDQYGVSRDQLLAYGIDPATFAGNVAVNDNAQPMTAGFDGFEASPGYQFRLQEGLKAIERSAAARGGLRSGATMKSLNNYAQGSASAEYENFANRLAALAGIGQNATAGSAQAGQNYGASATSTAANLGNIALNAGNARASAYANTGSAINNGVQNLASMYLYNQGYGGFGGGGGRVSSSNF